MYLAEYGGEPLYDPRDPDLLLCDQECSLSLDGPGSYTFTVPPGHPLSGAFEPMCKRREAVLSWDGEEVFRGRVVSVETDMLGNESVECEGERAYLNDVLLPPYDTSTGEGGAPGDADGLFAWMVAAYNDKVPEEGRFHVGRSDGWSLGDFPGASLSARSSVWDEMRSKLVEAVGGTVRVRHENGLRWIDWLADGGDPSGQRIRFGENLLDLARTVDGLDLCTRVVPSSTYEAEVPVVDEETGEPELDGDGAPRTRTETLSADISGVPDRPLEDGYAKVGDAVVNVALEAVLGAIERAASWEGVSDPEELVELALRECRGAALGDTLEVRAIDLSLLGEAERIRVGDYVRVTCEPRGVDGWMLCRAAALSPGDPERDSFTLGTASGSLTSQQAARIESLDASVSGRVEAAEALAKGAGQAAESVRADVAGAKADAGQARQDAGDALAEAERAAQAAADAVSAAQGALEGAQQAQGAAQDASKVATNYLGLSEDGLCVGDLTGEALGRNVLVAADFVRVRDGEVDLARYSADGIDLGCNSVSSAVSMCGGRARVSHDAASSYTTLSSSRSAAVMADTDESSLGDSGAASAALMFYGSDDGIGITRSAGKTNARVVANQIDLMGGPVAVESPMTLGSTLVLRSTSVREDQTPSATKYGNGVGFVGGDPDMTRNANVQLEQSTDGTLWLREEVRRYVGETIRYNVLRLGLDASGNPKYSVSSPAALRSAAGAAPASAMTAQVSSQTSLGTSRAAAPLAASASAGSDFAISGGKVRCGFSGTVLVSAAAFFSFLSGEASPGVENPELAVAVNGEVAAAAGVVCPGQWGAGAALPPALVAVSSGDLISYMVVNNTAARGVVRAISANYLTVQRVS